jgi:hypothetical protein
VLIQNASASVPLVVTKPRRQSPTFWFSPPCHPQHITNDVQVSIVLTSHNIRRTKHISILVAREVKDGVCQVIADRIGSVMLRHVVRCRDSISRMGRSNGELNI